MVDKAGKLSSIIEPAVAALGYELIGCELSASGRYSILRVYIDSPQGVTIDACERVSRQVSALLEIEEPVRGGYNLEVSSPGLERPLFKREHYQRFLGHKIQVRLHSAIEGRRNLLGVLQDVKEHEITLVVNEATLVVSFSQIQKAHLSVEVNIGKLKRRGDYDE